MNKFSFSTLLVAVCLLIIPIYGQADSVVRTGNTVSIANDGGVVGDFYGLGNVVSVSGTVDGDFVSVAGSLTLNGEVQGDLLAAGASVDVHGPVGDDLRIVGGEVVIADAVGGDVVVVGANVSILSTASIAGDLLLYGGEVSVEAPVGGAVLGTVSQLRIDSEVTGDITVKTGQLTLGDNAVVTGAVTYESDQLVQRSPNAVVEGELLRNDSVLNTEETSPYRSFAIAALVLAFASLAWYLLARKRLHLIAEKAISFSVRPWLIGAVVLIVTPVAVTVLLTSMLGMLVGLVVLFAYLFTLLLAVIATPVAVGLAVLKLLNQSTRKLSPLVVLFGVFVCSLLTLLPVVGPVILFAAFIVSFGALVETFLVEYKK